MQMTYPLVSEYVCTVGTDQRKLNYRTFIEQLCARYTGIGGKEKMHGPDNL